MSNVQRLPEYTQVCLWPGTIVGRDKVEEFQQFISDNFDGTRIQYLEEITTLPDLHQGQPVSGTGGRNDTIFSIHQEDIPKFAVPRLRAGIRWIEDVLNNEDHHVLEGHQEDTIYPRHLRDYCTW